MIWVLKAILLIILTSVIIGIRYFINDWRNTRKSPTYDNITPFEKLRFNLIFLLIITSLSSLGVFNLYFLFSKITVEFPLW